MTWHAWMPWRLPAAGRRHCGAQYHVACCRLPGCPASNVDATLSSGTSTSRVEPANGAPCRVLEKLGLVFERELDEDKDGDDAPGGLRLYASHPR